MELLVEGTFARLFAGHVHPRDVALQLARALEDSAASGMAGTHYTVRLNPSDARDLLNAHPDLAEQLAVELLGLAREAHLTLAQPPEVSVVATPAQAAHTIAVSVESRPAVTSATQTMAAVPATVSRSTPRAFLILDGQRTIPLHEAVINIGRRLDNQIVVDDPSVSRNHAQLRLRYGHYVVYNLGSTGGTFVNGQRIEECVLRPGDVISLGSVPLIYGEDSGQSSGPQRSARSTLPLVPPGDKRGGPQPP
jgi:FHA domain-containing protein